MKMSATVYITEIRFEKTALRNSRNRKQNACVNAGKKRSKICASAMKMLATVYIAEIRFEKTTLRN